METRSVSSSRPRGSIPLARSRTRMPTAPGSTARSSTSESAASPPIVFTPAAASRSSARGPTPGSARTGNGARKLASLPGGTTVMPPGLRRSEATLHTTFEVETPERARQRRRGSYGDLHGVGQPAGACEVAHDGAEVEVPLVDPDLLDLRDDLADRRPHGLRVLPVERVPRPDEDDLGAAAQGFGRAHGRADAEAAGGVVGGCDDPSPLRVAADDERPLAQRRILQLLDGREERVEIEVGQDGHSPPRLR